MKKRILSVLLVLMLLTALMPVALADSAPTSGTCGADGDNLTWELVDGTLTISGTGAMTDYDLDWDYRYFKGELRGTSPWPKSITAVVIENGVMTIGDFAFCGCSALTSVEIPAGVTKIGGEAFCDCSTLTSVTIPNSVTEIGSEAFYNCSALTNVTIPNSVTEIGSEAFYNCSALTNVTIPDSVTEIGGSVFRGCSSLTSVTIPDGVKTIGSYMFYGCSSLTSVTIPESVTQMNECVFSGCSSLTSISLSSNITYIDNDLFNGCSSLENITLPDGIVRIEEYAFQDCSSLKSIVIPESVKYIRGGAFRWCTSLESVTLPTELVALGMDNDWSSLLGHTFDGCISLKSITIPACKQYGGNFANCTSLKEAIFADGAASTGSDTFSGCTALESVTIPNSVTEIGDHAFEGCGVLTNIVIPNSVTTIGDYAFGGCSSLTNFNIPSAVTGIGGYAFEDCSGLINIAIPSGVSAIAPGTFSGCSSLAEITIPDNVTEIGHHAFAGCTSLKHIKLPSNLEKIGLENTTWQLRGEGYVFENCISLTNIDIPESVTEIGSNAFENCTSLQSIVLPDGVEKLNAELFNGCSSLKSVTLPANIESIGSTSFKGCTGLETITIPDKVKTIEKSAFFGCSSLKTVNLPVSVTLIDERAFEYCGSISTVNYAGTLAQWNAINFTYYNEALTKCKNIGIKDHTHSYANGACSGCGATDPNGSQTTPPEQGHTHNYAASVVKPTCTTAGYTVYTCAGCGSSYNDAYTSALGHDYKNGACTRCGATDPNYTKPTEPGHTHSYTTKVVDPTCTEQGYTLHTCAGCGDSYKDTYVKALGHDYKDGACTRCEAKDPNYVPPHEHSYTDVVTAPTCLEKGFTTHTCACGDVKVDTYVDALGHDYKDGACTRCGAKDVTFNPFKDVDKTTHADYYDAILWAYYNDITKGTNATGDEFSPAAPCTRAQIVTFLWRQSGAPVAEVANPFTDVDKVKHSDYYNAILWGYSTGVIKGVSDTEFAPDKVCTRAEIVTMLYRLDGENAVKTGTQFTDLTQVWYKDAIAWAVAEGITKGTSDTTFTPDAPCTRAQTVTFLYRYFA